jgi:hypothetical protein
LRGLLDSTRRLASRLAGFSTMTGILGIPVWLNIDRSWNCSWSVSSSSSSEVSSMVTVSSPSLTSRCSFFLTSSFPCASSASCGGEGGSETYFAMSSYNIQQM